MVGDPAEPGVYLAARAEAPNLSRGELMEGAKGRAISPKEEGPKNQGISWGSFTISNQRVVRGPIRI